MRVKVEPYKVPERTKVLIIEPRPIEFVEKDSNERSSGCNANSPSDSGAIQSKAKPEASCRFDPLIESEPVDISDSQSSKKPLTTKLQPTEPRQKEVISHLGRGRHIKYLMKWSNNNLSWRSKKDIRPDLLLKYQRKTRAINTDRCRKRMKRMHF